MRRPALDWNIIRKPALETRGSEWEDIGGHTDLVKGSMEGLTEVAVGFSSLVSCAQETRLWVACL